MRDVLYARYQKRGVGIINFKFWRVGWREKNPTDIVGLPRSDIGIFRTTYSSRVRSVETIRDLRL